MNQKSSIENEVEKYFFLNALKQAFNYRLGVKLAFIFLKSGTGQQYIHALCSIDVCVNIYEVWWYTRIGEIHKFMSNMPFRKSWGLLSFSVKRRCLD